MTNQTLADKKEYFAIDLFKLLAAYLNMSVHFNIFKYINTDLDFWWSHVFCRIGVPYFFITSGYFAANKLHDKEKIKEYLKRIFFMYTLYTIIFLPDLIKEYRGYGMGLLDGSLRFVKEFLFSGSYFHLWFFLALLVGVLFLYLLINKFRLNDKKLLVVTGIFYGVGALGNAYRNIWRGIPVIEAVWRAYEAVFMTTRNGIFFAPLLLVLGYLIRKHSAKITYKRYWLYTILFFALMNIEEYFAYSITKHAGQSMLFVTPFVVCALFLTTCFIKTSPKLIPLGIFMRNMSVIVYGFHVLIHVMFGAELSGYTYIMEGLPYFLMIVKRITVVAVVIVGLSRIKFFSWLKYLY